MPATPPAYTSAQTTADYGYSNNYAVEGSTVPAPEVQSYPAPQNYSAPQSYPSPQRYPAQPAQSGNSLTIRNASYVAAPPRYANTATGSATTNLRPAVYTTQPQRPPLRPEVQNVIRALRAMPPAARQRQLDSGRYSNLTPAELEYVRQMANIPG